MTMEVCQEIEKTLQAVFCKNLFLCNRQETAFCLLMIPDTKVFHTKDLSAQIHLSLIHIEMCIRDSNKSHAACYAYVAFQTAYLKCHYPREFMAALLTSVLDSTATVSYTHLSIPR